MQRANNDNLGKPIRPTRQRMRASEIRELLKLLDQPDVINFAGGIPTRLCSPPKRSRQPIRKFWQVRTRAAHCNTA